MSGKSPEIVALGECMIELLSDEPLDVASTFRKSYAGDTLNMLHMATKLGTSCGYVTRLATDPFADYLMAEWRRTGIDTTAVRRVPGFTGMHFISLLPDGDREFLFYRKESAASTMTPDDLDHEYIAGAKILHVSGILQAVSPSCRETVLHAAQSAKRQGVPVSYDTNLRANMWSAAEAREAMDEILPFVDYVLPSHPEETDSLIGALDPRGVIDFFLQKGAGAVAVSQGENGATAGTSAGAFQADPITPGGVADTAGAGDAFVGGFLHSLLQGEGADEGLKWGIACAGLKVAARGAIAGQPTRTDVEQWLDTVEVRSA